MATHYQSRGDIISKINHKHTVYNLFITKFEAYTEDKDSKHLKRNSINQISSISSNAFNNAIVKSTLVNLNESKSIPKFSQNITNYN